MLLGHGVICIFRRGPQSERTRHPTPIRHPGVEMRFSWVSSFCFDGEPFWKWASLLGQGWLKNLPWRRISQKSRHVFLKAVLPMLCERWFVQALRSVEAYSMGKFPDPQSLGPFWDFLFVKSTTTIYCQSGLLRLNCK